MSIKTDTLMASLQTKRQGFKHDSLTSIVSTSGVSIIVTVELQRWALAAWLADYRGAFGYFIKYPALVLHYSEVVRRVRFSV